MAEHPPYTPEEQRARETFLTLMWALSYPGRVSTLNVSANAAFLAIADALIDLETSYFTPHAALNTQLQRTGARSLSAETAAYHFYPHLHDLSSIEAASVGTLQYPDDAATLIIGCTFDSGLTLQLSGPGIQGTTDLQVALPARFWDIRSRARYPLGWDVFLIDGTRVIGLPRTTIVEIRGG